VSLPPEPPRDWDKELAQIDKIIAQTPRGAAPVPAAGGAGAARPAAAEISAPTPRRKVLGAWLRVLLGVGLAAGVTRWPYLHTCGVALYLYLGALGVTLLGGFWAAVAAWRRRMGLAHTVSLLVMLWGGVLLTSEVLPRIGYAKHTAAWGCP